MQVIHRLETKYTIHQLIHGKIMKNILLKIMIRLNFSPKAL